MRIRAYRCVYVGVFGNGEFVDRGVSIVGVWTSAERKGETRGGDLQCINGRPSDANGQANHNVTQKRLSWYGHVMRRDDTNVAKKVTQVGG